MHVLVCEDDELIASGIVAGLSAQGLTVEHVATASAARARCASELPRVMPTTIPLACWFQ